ncbi:MAG: hypothetical protein ACC628_10860 [Pirellulaceae bacterium]
MNRVTENDGEDRELRDELQKFVNLVGLVSGALGITVHEHMALKVEIAPVVMLRFNASRRGKLTSVDEVVVRVAGVEAFVRSRLENLILARVGGFGRVEVEVEAGSIATFGYRTKIRGAPKNE